MLANILALIVLVFNLNQNPGFLNDTKPLKPLPTNKPSTEKVETVNIESGKDIKKVAEIAVINSQALIEKGEPAVGEKPSPHPELTPHPTPWLTPHPTPNPTIEPLPSSRPEPFPCPKLPIEAEHSTKDPIFCPDIY